VSSRSSNSGPAACYQCYTSSLCHSVILRSKDSDRIKRRTGRFGKAQRGNCHQKFPTPFPLAIPGLTFELQAVRDAHSHGGNLERVNGILDPLHAGRYGFAIPIGEKDSHLPLVEQGEAVRIERQRGLPV
jgi:hypothetical protein